MAKLNEGDVIEGIFTIALALYISYGEINKVKLNRIRTQIDTKLFNSGRFKYTVVKNQKRQKGKNIPDFFDVTFEMRLKPQSVFGAFGEEYEVLYKSSQDVGKIDKKIDALIKYVNNTNFSRKIDTAINKFLDNNVGELVTFNVVADGIAGESSDGQIKGDITLDIHAKTKSQSKKIVSESISFSLKSESVTVANLSPYRGMLDIAKAMNISWNGEQKYSRLAKPFNGSTEQQAKFKLIEEMYSALKKKIKSVSTSPDFTDKALGFLHESIFGKDLADVIDIQSGAVKEIDVEYFNSLRKSIKLEVEEKGNNLIFVDKSSKAPIFQIRTKLRESANEAKFYLEVGKGIYRK